MKKKYNYIDEKDNNKQFIGITLVILLFVTATFIEQSYLAFLTILILYIIIALCFLFASNNRKKFILRKKEIMEKGLKISGKIVGTNLINQHEDTKGNIRYDISLDIEYFYDNQKNLYQTPAISFSNKDLISNDVDVYILNREIYVDGFKFK